MPRWYKMLLMPNAVVETVVLCINNHGMVDNSKRTYDEEWVYTKYRGPQKYIKTMKVQKQSNVYKFNYTR